MLDSIPLGRIVLSLGQLPRTGFRGAAVWPLAVTIPLVLFPAATTWAVTANALAVMPENGMGIHASVYDCGLRYEGLPVFERFDSALDGAGVNVLRYPGGGMDIWDSVRVT